MLHFGHVILEHYYYVQRKVSELENLNTKETCNDTIQLTNYKKGSVLLEE